MIRKAETRDLARIAEMYDAIIDTPATADSEVGWIKGVYPTRKTAEDGLSRGDLFVLEDEGRIVASAVINQAQMDSYADGDWQYAAEPEEVMVLHTLCVFPEEGKKGYGRQFVSFYEEYAKAYGCRVLRMDTNAKNHRARHMYARLGYREAGIVPCTFQGIPNVELVCLEKEIGEKTMELKGKIINFLGDSITEGCGVEKMENRYDNAMKRKCGLKEVRNYGIGGTRYAYQTKPSEISKADLFFCGRAYLMEPEADIVVVYGGVNDYLHGDAPFGIQEDTTPGTFCGAVEYLMNFVKENYAEKTVVFLTPAHCNSDTNPSVYNGRPLSDYVKVISEKAKQHAFPCMNLFEELGIDPNNEEDREKYTADGLHFNDAGHDVLSDRLIAFLKTL